MTGVKSMLHVTYTHLFPRRSLCLLGFFSTFDIIRKGDCMFVKGTDTQEF